MLGKLGNLIPGIDNTILKQILTRGRGDLPSLFNNTSPSFIRKLAPSKIRLLIDQVNRSSFFENFRVFRGFLSMQQNQILRNIVNY
jgi:hypothetical protein